MNISDMIKGDTTKVPSLHETRYADMKNRALNEAVSKSIKSSESLFSDDAKGKDIYIKPLVYYNMEDCLNNVLKETDYVDKARKNIGIVKASRESKGQRLATKADSKDVLSEFQDEKSTTPTGLGEKVTFHRFVREWLGYLCQFEIKEQPVGFGQTKRNGFTISKVSVIYYGKNGIKLGKEIILRISFWMWNKTKKPEQEKV